MSNKSVLRTHEYIDSPKISQHQNYIVPISQITCSVSPAMAPNGNQPLQPDYMPFDPTRNFIILSIKSSPNLTSITQKQQINGQWA